MDIAKTFGNNLYIYRKHNNLTGQQLADLVGTTKSCISYWENGKSQPNTQTLMKICEILKITPDCLFTPMFENVENRKKIPNGTQRIRQTRIPVLGNIACGEPIFAEEQLEYYVDTISGIKADFALWAKGDSMIDARIHNGDLVFIKQQEMVENGEIAAVLINDEATLKRVYYDQNSGTITLVAANSKYAPFIYHGDELNNIKILGKAVAFQSLVK